MMRSHWAGLGALMMLGAMTIASGQESKSSQQRVARIDKLNLNIQAKPLDEALGDLAQESGLHIMLYSELSQGITCPAIRGSLTADEALKLMLAHTNLRFEYLDPQTVAVLSESANVTSRTGEHSIAQPETRMAAKAMPHLLSSTSSNLPVAIVDSTDNISGPSSSDNKIGSLEEVIVTGTNIRGSAPVGSPIETFNREDIERSGVATLGQFIQLLPQNFNGGPAPGTATSINQDARDNVGGGSSVNLHGLGGGTTLILLNGHRMAPSGINGSFVDISMIPATAIARVDVVADGASAIYGSDAIGGVVNFTLNDSYEGAETSVRYGAASGNTANEWRAGQIVGTHWDGGGIMGAYEFYQQAALRASDRSFASDSPVRGTTLLPEQKTHSLLLSAAQAIGDRLSITSDVLIGRRASNSEYLDLAPNFPEYNVARTDQANAALGLHYKLSSTWNADVTGVYSRNKVNYDNEPVVESGDTSAAGKSLSDAYSAEALLGGSIWSLPGGDLRTAFGTGFRRENYGLDTVSGTSDHLHRETGYLFAEALVPVIGAHNKIPGIHRLELSFAGRYDHYSDFGHSTIPKVGLVLAPMESLSFRGSFSRSFKAPLLENLVEQSILVLLEAPDPFSSTGQSLSLISVGNGNARLRPEKSRNWTAGLDWTIPGLPVMVALTYYDIDFYHRIQRPTDNAFVDVLANPAAFGSVLIRNPAAAFSASQIAHADQFFDAYGLPYALTDIQAFIDGRINNVAVQHQSGVDLTMNAHFPAPVGQFEAALSGTYIRRFVQSLTPNSLSVDVLNHVEAPINYRARGQVTWIWDGFSATSAVNYANHYTDIGVTPNVPVSSFTSFDLQLRYQVPPRSQSRSYLDNVSVSLSARNLFDRAPPYTVSTPDKRGYDPSNGDPLRRVISLDLSKRW